MNRVDRQRPLYTITTGVLVVAALGVLLTVAEVWLLATWSFTSLAMGMSLATLTTVPYSTLILWLDRHEKEPVWLISAGFWWGALACTALSGIVNETSAAALGALLGDAQIGASLAASLVAPIIEELTKAGALLVLFVRFRHHADGVLDGVVYGAVVGMGFAWFENALYYIQAYDNGIGAVLTLTWVRGVLSGVGTHATFTALTGVGFGLHRAMRNGSARNLAPVLGLSTAMLAHAMWNTGSSYFVGASNNITTLMTVEVPLAVAVLQAPFILLVVAVAALTWRHQDALIRTHLAAEADEVINDAQLERLVPARRRVLSGLRALLRDGIQGWWRHRALSQSLVRLAFERWHHEGDQRPGELQHDPTVQKLRRRIVRLRERGVTL